MSNEQVSDRQIKLLRVVAEGGDDWDARRIDITFSSRHGADGATALSQLEKLMELGLVTQDLSRSGPGGRWVLTAEGIVQSLEKD